MNCNNDKADAPLDPAIEKIRRRMMRLMVISVAIMMVGIIAVIGAVFYKINNCDVGKAAMKSDVRQIPSSWRQNNESDRKNNFTNLGGTIDLTGGIQMLETDLSGEKILLTIKTGKDKLELWIYDLKSNRMVSKIRVIE